MADITYQHRDYEANVDQWALVNDVCAGSDRVKDKGVVYLPKPNPTDLSDENKERYKQYLARAMFYNATRRTLQGLIGAAFRKEPMLEASGLDYVTDDIDGAGLSIYQQSQAVMEGVLKTGRYFLLTDYPKTELPASRADMDQGAIRSTVVAYPADSVTYWRTEKVGAKVVLAEVRISETVCEPDGFGENEIEQYRVLRLTGEGYTQEIWRKGSKSEWEIFDGPWLVTDSKGSAWREIPGIFVGSNNNDPGVDESPLYDLAVVNLAHYRNSADYEDSCYLTGQPQPWMAGLTEEWVKMLEARGIYFGSRAPIMLPEGGSFGIAQVQSNTIVKEAMDQKEQQMIALGARLLTPGGAVKTATEAQSDREAEHSVLSLVASNVSEAYTKCLEWMALFNGVSGTYEYEISQDYVESHLDAQMLTAVVGAQQAGIVPKADVWQFLRSRGLIAEDKDNETIAEELDNELDLLDLGTSDETDQIPASQVQNG